MIPDEQLKAIPAVDLVLRHPDADVLAGRYGRSQTVDAIRAVIERMRSSILQGDSLADGACDASRVLVLVKDLLHAGEAPKLKRVVNATGIILHTGLGRAVMPDVARDALAGAIGYCNLQIDLDTGKRNKREECIRELIRDLTGAEDVLLTNNNAGATLLLLRALARGKEVIVSRGELIEIGGSFRLPEIMSESGAILREVGATNKTHLRDYEKAIGPETALLLKVHKSNFRIVGFTEEVGIQQIAELGKRNGIPAIDDLGCGALVGLEQFGMQHEITVAEIIRAGADLVLFSTDKLIGGPQGGMIVGRKEMIALIRSCPLYRALRVCKLTLAALEATLRLFKAPEHLARNHPVYEMLSKSPADMASQATELARQISEMSPKWNVRVTEEVAYLGGGSLPATEMKSFAVRIATKNPSADDFAERLRAAPVPVIARVKDDAVILDMRTVSASDIPAICCALRDIAIRNQAR